MKGHRKLPFISSKAFFVRYHKRDPATAQDNSPSKDGFLDFINTHPDVWAVADFQCTYPTQDPGAIVKAHEMINSGNMDCVFAATRSQKFRWSKVTGSTEVTHALNFDPTSRPRRQDWDGDIIESGMCCVVKFLLLPFSLRQTC